MKTARLLASVSLGLGILGACGSGDVTTTVKDGGASNCTSEQTLCDEACVDVESNASHCGSCSNSCAAGEVCAAGNCAVNCIGGTTKCGDSCVDVDVDPKHCGGCGFACKDDEVCQAGACSVVCAAGTTKCGSTCADTDVDPLHCGACDSACDSEDVCQQGSCVLVCVGGTTKCASHCVDTDYDPGHCGSCDAPCKSDEICAGGGCCPFGELYCASNCIDPLNDVGNCGSCGNSCAGATPFCSGGACIAAGESCAAHLKVDPNAQDGLYPVDPDGAGPVQPFMAFCDMSNDGGGWTLVANVDDINDPYFGGFNATARETAATRNESEIPTFSKDVIVSTKYTSWSTVPATDLRIVYKNDSKYFLCEGMSTVDTLDKLFSIVPANGQCAVTCSSVSEDRFAQGATSTPMGLNCSDGNQPWYPQSSVAENARIGGFDADNTCCVMNAYLGAMGDRGWGPNPKPLERTWSEYSSGVEKDNNIMVFVR